jgi:chromosome segregation protein
MHLQSLELFGFKSFADKTTFNFHEGVTAVVGPNGCGKSNLLDAVKWVLGEQSARSLRGGEMADVIFNGTDTRKPLGFAEVSLTFTECASELEVDWNEVRVSRRVYRDGNSEYFLNKTPCRLRDIQNLFADTGIARAAYSMMEQGKIDMVLSSRPEDRRAVFEEAAGVTKYKTQKREALRKLEATEANLLRIGDIIKEVKRQIGSLQRQAGKARRYQTLLADLRTLDTHHSRKKLESIETSLAHCQSELAQLTKSEKTTRDEIEADENNLRDQRHTLDELDAKIAGTRAGLQRVESAIETHRNRIEFNRQRAVELGELIERAQKDIAGAETKRAEQHEAIKQANLLVEQTHERVLARETELEQLTALISQARTERLEQDTELATIEAAISKHEARVSELENDLSGIVIRRDATQESQHDLEVAISEANATRSKMEQEIAVARTGSAQSQKDVDLLKAEAQTRQASVQEQRQQLSEIEKKLNQIERALTETQSRLEILRQLNEEGEGLGLGSQAVLKGLGNPDRIQPALAGAFVSQLEVDPKFIRPIEAALGRNLHAIILREANMAPQILATLAKKKLGQAALIVPDFCRSSSDQMGPAPENSLGWAIDRVQAPESLASITRQLLHKVALFEDLESALAARKAQNDIAAATLAGEFISREGVLFGGSSEVAADSLLERKARVALLEKEHSELTQACTTVRKQRDETRDHVEKATQAFEQARARFEHSGRDQSASENRIQFLERELNEIERKIDSFRSEHATLAQQIAAADKRVAELEAQLVSGRDQLGGQQAQQAEVEAALDSLATRESELTEKLNELRLALATERQRHEHVLAQREPMAARETELAETIATRRKEIEHFQSRLAAQASESKDSETTIQRQADEREQLEIAVAALSQERATAGTAIEESESSLRRTRNSLNELHDLRSQEQVRASQLQMEITQQIERIQRRYQLDLRSLVPDEAAFEKTLRVQVKTEKEAMVDLTRTEEVIAEMTRRLDEMGPVNLDAVQEYDELEERYKFLESQNNDLTNSRRELLDVIARINSTTQKLFAETFAQVRVNFREMFSELFGGGRADLALMDENDPLNCGIEISAKPPGKQLQSVSLLSGGERAMTAVALLFAIYMVRPSPFCVLDEIDAPMDESNINRFTRMLDRFVEQSQFVIITHNKRTIAKADVLYGVTMEERGVSKLVGMKLSAPRDVIVETVSNGHGNGHTETETATQRHLALAAR